MDRTGQTGDTGETRDTGETGESAFGDDGWIEGDDEVQGGWRGDDRDAEAQP